MLEQIWYDQIFVLPLSYSKGQPCMCINISLTIYSFAKIWWEIHKLRLFEELFMFPQRLPVFGHIITWMLEGFVGTW